MSKEHLEILFWITLVVLGLLVFVMFWTAIRSGKSNRSAMDIVHEGHKLNKRQTKLLEEMQTELKAIKELMEKR